MMAKKDDSNVTRMIQILKQSTLEAKNPLEAQDPATTINKTTINNSTINKTS